MFNNTDLNIAKYLGWLERIIDIILKLFGMGKSETTAAPVTTTEAVVEEILNN
ncbi:MAG: hypothetical protein IKL09_01395 [Clostridia bacterium]|nr:hypothetical protein [Clostridia bacterium]